MACYVTSDFFHPYYHPLRAPFSLLEVPSVRINRRSRRPAPTAILVLKQGQPSAEDKTDEGRKNECNEKNVASDDVKNKAIEQKQGNGSGMKDICDCEENKICINGSRIVQKKKKDNDSGEYQYRFNVNGFKLDDIDVRVMEPDEKTKYLVMEAKSGNSGDESVYYEYKRERHALPDNVDVERLRCKLSRDGYLTVTVGLPYIPQVPIAEGVGGDSANVKDIEVAQEGQVEDEEKQQISKDGPIEMAGSKADGDADKVTRGQEDTDGTPATDGEELMEN